jgi:chitinase
MKTQHSRFVMATLAAMLAGLLASTPAQAQFGFGGFGFGGLPPAPKVTVWASQPLAYEPGNSPGAFTLSRGTNTNSALTVTCTFSGTATNGVDYVAVPTSVTFAAGQSQSNLIITPVAEPAATGYKTVALEVSQSGSSSHWPWGGIGAATVYIAYNYTNVPPTVSIASPTNNASFPSRPNIAISAKAGDSNGWVTSVDFFVGTTSIAVVSNQPFGFGPFTAPPARKGHAGLPPILPAPQNNPFTAVWTNVPPGPYVLTAVATDNTGLQTTSAPVNITVTTALPVPEVRIAAPASGSTFPSNSPINLVAAAGEQGNGIVTVEFLNNGTSLGTVAASPIWLPIAFGTNIPKLPFQFFWINAPVGSNSVTALATDNNGIQVTSAPVNINVKTNSYRRGWFFGGF